MDLYNIDNMIKVKCYRKKENKHFTVILEDYYQKSLFIPFVKYKVTKGIYDLYGKKSDLDEVTKDDSYVENDKVYYYPYMIIDFSDGNYKCIYFKDIYKLEETYSEIESKIQNKINL